MAKYAAFLRGINVGGHKPVPMEKLKKAFESLKFTNVRTLLASGNVMFDAPPLASAALRQKIEEKLKKVFGMDISVLVRTKEELQGLADLQPFKGIELTPDTHLYMTFLSQKPKSSAKIFYSDAATNFKILRVSESEVCSVLTPSPGKRTVDLMSVLEKEFGNKITTRNWNTIVRILEMDDQ